jgi:hypothetical protein
VQAIPVTVRLAYVRRIAFSYYRGRLLSIRRQKYQRFYQLNSNLTIEGILAHFFSIASEAIDKHGKVLIQCPFWNKVTLKSLGYMCALSLLYGIRLPIRIDESQLKLLLGFDRFELDRLKTHGDGSGLFAGTPLLPLENHHEIRRIWAQTVAIVLATFKSTVRFVDIVPWHEIRHIFNAVD